MGGYHQLPITPYNPQQPDTMEQFSRAMALKSMLQNAPLQHQALQQQVQSGQLGLEQQQMQMQSQQAMMKAYTEANGNLEQAVPLAAKYGAMPGDVVKLRTAAMEQQKANLDLLQKKGERALQEADWMQGAHDAVAKAPPEQRPQIWQQQVQALAQAGVDVSQVPQQYPGDQAFSILGIGLKGHKQQLEDLAKQADIRKTTAEAAKAEAETQAGGNAAMADAKYRSLVQQQQLKKPLTAEDQAWMRAYEKQKTMVPQFNFNLQNQGIPLPSFPEGTTPEQMYKSFGAKSGVIRGIVEGRQSPPSAFAQKTPYWQDVMQKVYQVDPQWSEQRAQLRKTFSSGPDGRNIRNLNTAVVHLDTLQQVMLALKNGSFRPGNEVFNKFKTMFGAGAPTTFEGIRDAYAGEAAAALKGNATDIEIANVRHSIETKNSPEQFNNYADTMMEIFGQKLSTYQQQYQQYNPGDTVWNPVLPQAQAVFESHRTQVNPSQQTKPGNRPPLSSYERR